MATRSKQEEFQKLSAQITEWNANRLDLFELSQPNEDLEFFGVMRFFFQDATSKVATKCIRVASSATTQDVLDTLVEKFRPDMRMLTMPHYSLYEVHANGEERKLADKERPLFVQLNWGKDDREGRFLLKNEDHNKNVPLHADSEAPGTFKRKLSKREKKELKKKEKEAKLKGKENEKPGEENVAEKLYNDMPDTSFTRTISNPEVVMRRRRQQKLEKKLAEIRNKDDQGGTLKIYGESISPDVPYKTLLLSSQDTAEYVVKETLAKYGLEKVDPTDYCLIQVLVPPNSDETPGMGPNQQFFILDEDDCPLAILMQHPPNEGTVMFQLKRRTSDMPRSRKKKKARTDERDQRALQQENLPFFTEINPDGSSPNKPRQHRLPLDIVEVGSDRSLKPSPTFFKILNRDILQRHCVIAHSEGMVTITPALPEAETLVNGRRIMETTMLQHGMVVQFGRHEFFKFIDPLHEEKAKHPHGDPAMQQQAQQQRGPGAAPSPLPPQQQQQQGPPPHQQGPPPHDQQRMDTAPPMQQSAAPPMGQPQQQGEDLLPAAVEYREEAEDAYLASSVQRVNGQALQFKLAPTYALYLAVRFRLVKPPQMPLQEREILATRLINKTCDVIDRVVHEQQTNAAALSFWMANASELLHFYKQDGDVARLSQDSQDDLAGSVQVAFHHLVTCLQRELQHVMVAFLDESTEDLSEEEVSMSNYPRGKPNIMDVLNVLTNAMALLRRCRVNAALTIQLFSQLFHFVNMWLFNKLVTEPRLGLCTRGWGHRLKRRLSRIEIWAEKQGLELAADCHLARIIQAAHLLEAPKGSPDDILHISSTCFKLNSLQLKALLQNYIPSANEAHIQPELIQRVVGVAQSTADELTRSDGRDVRLEEDPDLQLPFLLPEDGYSCDIVKAVPNGLADFLDSVAHSGICRWYVNNQSKGLWTVYMEKGPENPPENLRATQMGGQPGGMDVPPGAGLQGKDPEVMYVTFSKVKGSMGLSIVAAKGEGQRERGIYIKSVVPGGGAAADGRLQAGDQLLEVDSKSLIGLTQEKAAEMMTQTGNRVTLKVAKQGAIYHGLATVLSQQSPIMQRAGPHPNAPFNGPPPQQQGGVPPMVGKQMGPPPHSQQPQQMKPRPISEDVSRFGPPNGHPPGMDQGGFGGAPPGQRPIQMQHGAKSSPSLAPGRGMNDSYNMPPGMGAPPPHMGAPNDPYRGPQQHQDQRSKSVSNLDQQARHPELDANRQPPSASTSTLPRMHPHHHGAGPQPHQQGGPPGPQPGGQHLSQPDLRGPGGPRNQPHREEDYVNYPGPQHRPEPDHGRNNPQADYVNQRDLKNQGSHSMQNLRGAGPGEDMNNSRVLEWQQRNEMVNRGGPNQPGPQGNMPGQGNMPPGAPGQYHSLQRALDPQSTLRGQRIGPRPPMDPRDPRFNQQQQNFSPNTSKSQQDFPPHSQSNHSGYGPNQGGPNQQRNMPPHMNEQRPGHMSPDGATYENFPPQSGQFPPQNRPDSQRGDKLSPHPQQHDPRMRNMSPEFPPPPEVPPEMPPPPSAEDMRNAGQDEFPPPPPGTMGQGYPNNNQSFNNRFASPQPSSPSSVAYNNSQAHNYMRGGPEGTYTQAPSQPGAPHNPNTLSRNNNNLSQSTGSLNNRQGAKQQPGDKPTPAGKKPPPPIKAKPKLNLAEVRKGFTQSPWEREEKERETKRREEEMRVKRDNEIQDLETKSYLTQEEQERLRRLRLDREFDKRVTEVDSRSPDNDDDDDEISPAARVNMLRQVKEDMARKRSSLEEERKRNERQQELEKNERTERRLALYEQEREEQRQRQKRQQEQRQREQDEILKKQRELREIQRREFEEAKRQVKEEDLRLEQQKRDELRKKKEMEKDQLRDMQAAREAEERAMREREEQMRRQFDRMQVAADGGSPQTPPGGDPYSQVANRAAPAPPERNSSYMYGGRAGSNSNLPASGYNDNPRATPQSKKSVSFDSNLATEIGVRRNKESVGSDSSYMNYQVNVGSPEADEPPSSAYGQRGGNGNPSDAVNQLFDAPPSSQHQSGPGYGGPPPSSQGPGAGTQYPGSQQQYPPPHHQQPPPTSQYGNNYHPNTSQHQPPSSQYNPPSSQFQAPSSQYQPQQGRPQQPYQNGPQYPPPPGNAPPPSTYHNGPNQYPPYQGGPGSYPQQSQQYGYNSPAAAGPGGSPYTPNTNNGYEPSPQQQQAPGPAARTPQGGANPPPTMLITNADTPGVVGGQEVYRDPRDRLLAERQHGKMMPGSAERMSFRDKMKMFATEAGENTPQDKSKASHAQRRIDSQIASP